MNRMVGCGMNKDGSGVYVQVRNSERWDATSPRQPNKEIG